MGLLTTIKLDAVPETKADKFTGKATVGEIKQKEIANGYVQVVIPFIYELDNGTERTFTARANVKPEWFSGDYAPPVGFEKGTAEYNEAIAYSMNMSRIIRKLFKSAGLDTIDFDAIEGSVVGITIGPESDKRDPSRQELKNLFSTK